MAEAPKPKNEGDRLRTLQEYGLLDTLPEESFDRIVGLAANACGAPIALFSLVNGDRQWFKARVGLDVDETSRELSFCAHAVASDEILVVDDATADARFVDNTLVLDTPGIRFYAGVPVHARNSQPLGTLCVIDTVARSLSDKQRRVLESLAREIEVQLELRQVMHRQQQLVDERAVLTHMILHDAGGTLAALRWNFKLLRDNFGDDVELLEQSQRAADELMHLFESVSHISDSRSRDVAVKRKRWNLRACLKSIGRRAASMAKELGVTVEVRNELPHESVETDAYLLERMLVNLVRNALQVARPDESTITISGYIRADSVLVLSVEDDGPGVPAAIAERIFEPYFSHRERGPKGSGLGLAFCRLAAQALGGSIQYRPRQPEGAVFTIEVPLERLSD